MKPCLTLSLIPLFICVLGTARASDSGNPGGSPVAVVIDGVRLTAEDVDRKLPGRLLQARSTYYQTERKTVEEFIETYLLERAAKQEGVTVEALLERHQKAAAAKEPTEDALRLYYELVNTTEPFEKVRAQLVERIQQARMVKAKAVYLDSLRRKANVAVVLPA